jgi:endonuclease III related protein
VVGAYLTQTTAWTNVELALRRLRANGLLNLEAIRNTPLLELEMLIRSSILSAESSAAENFCGLC